MAPVRIKASAVAGGLVPDQKLCLKGLVSAASQLMGSPPSGTDKSEFSSSEDEQLPQAEHAGAVHGLQLQELIGRGAFGSVYRAVWRGMQVAVKVGASHCKEGVRHPCMRASGDGPRKKRCCEVCTGDRA